MCFKTSLNGRHRQEAQFVPSENAKVRRLRNEQRPPVVSPLSLAESSLQQVGGGGYSGLSMPGWNSQPTETEEIWRVSKEDCISTVAHSTSTGSRLCTEFYCRVTHLESIASKVTSWRCIRVVFVLPQIVIERRNEVIVWANVAAPGHPSWQKPEGCMAAGAIMSLHLI